MQASIPPTISIPADKAKLRRVHGEHLRVSCPYCRGGANLAAVNGGLAEHDGHWFCDDCPAGGRYDHVGRSAHTARYRMRMRDVATGVH